MFTEHDLNELVKFRTSDPVISLYLNTEPSGGNADTYKLRMRSMIKDVGLVEDALAIERYFDHEYDWSGRSVAVFSCYPQNFFKTYPLALPVPNKVRVNDRPGVKPLASLLDIYGGYGIALVDKQNLKMFTFNLGVLKEHDGFIGEEVKRTKRGGASTFPGRRGGLSDITGYSEEMIDKNIKEAAEFAARFFEENHVRRIIIGGTDKNTAMFFENLPRHIQSLVMDTIPISLNISQIQLQEKMLEICKNFDDKKGKHTIRALITNASKGKEASLGLEDTLDAVNSARVQVLVVSHGFQEAGFRCPGCDFLSLNEGEKCIKCQKSLVSDKDVVELAVGNVLRLGGKVNVVDNDLLVERGKIGAMLRY